MTESRDAGKSTIGSEDSLRDGAAQFLGQVLGISESPTYLANDLSSIKRDTNASIFTIQLDSSVGPAAFLVYAYVLQQRGGDGHSGKELFDTGLVTLQQAAQRSTPGPRAVAHAETEEYGFILATTPGTYRALTGEPEVGTSLEATQSDLIAIEESARIRSDIAQELLHTLRTANDQATEWLTAVHNASQRDIPEDEGIDDILEFTEQETELALYLLDDDSIGNLLRALNLLVATAQQQTANALDGDHI